MGAMEGSGPDPVIIIHITFSKLPRGATGPHTGDRNTGVTPDTCEGHKGNGADQELRQAQAASMREGARIPHSNNASRGGR